MSMNNKQIICQTDSEYQKKLCVEERLKTLCWWRHIDSRAKYMRKWSSAWMNEMNGNRLCVTWKVKPLQRIGEQQQQHQHWHTLNIRETHIDTIPPKRRWWWGDSDGDARQRKLSKKRKYHHSNVWRTERNGDKYPLNRLRFDHFNRCRAVYVGK